MSQQPFLRQHLKADENGIIHIEIPPHMGDDFDILIFPSGKSAALTESQLLIKLFEETAFARDILNSPEEECWNDL